MLPQSTPSETEEMALKRTIRIVVRVSEAEKRKFEKAAKANHQDLSEYMRQVAHRAADASEKEQAA
jgi:uncharacterized protein (DUF1778 family)